MSGMYETVGGQIEPPLPPPSPRRCATLRFRPPLLPLPPPSLRHFVPPLRPLPPSPLRHFVPPRLRPPLLRHPNTKIIKNNQK